MNKEQGAKNKDMIHVQDKHFGALVFWWHNYPILFVV